MKDLWRQFRNGSGPFLVVALLAIGLSLVTIVWAARTGIWADAGRGGAVGCALTFLMFFVGRPTAARALEFGSSESKPDPLALPAATTLAEALQQINALKEVLASVRGSTSAMLAAAGREKAFLSVASVASTVAWGFGDCAAEWLRGWLHWG